MNSNNRRFLVSFLTAVIAFSCSSISYNHLSGSSWQFLAFNELAAGDLPEEVFADGFENTQAHTDKDDTVTELPVLSTNPPSPSGLSVATVTVDSPGATSIELEAGGSGCGAFSFHQANASRLEVTTSVAAFGVCQLEANVTGGPEAGVFLSSFEVVPEELVLPAVKAVDGIFIPNSPPPATGTADDPNVASIAAPGSIINGGTVELRLTLVDPTQAANITQALVVVPTAPGFDGHWLAPVVIDGDQIIVKLGLDADFGAPGRPASDALSQLLLGGGENGADVFVQLLDSLGNVGEQVSRFFDFTNVTAGGDVQVSLSWDTPTDVDLHLVEPGGFEIYYGTPFSPSGGQLDLDSNPGCLIDGVNNENITYSGVAPPGEYIVRVDFWESCGGLAANFVVTVTACGTTETYSGSFAPGSHSHGGLGSGREITRFTADCSSRVRGKATYEDFAQTTTGLAAASTMLPIRFADVEVRRASDDAVLGEGDTLQDGSFDISFINEGTPGYYVLVKAKQDNEVVKQSVQNAASQIYTVRSMGTIDESAEPDKTGLMIEAKKASNGPGPAFNIFDQGVAGAALLKRTMGVTPRSIKWQWDSGQKGACSGNVSCYFRGSRKISVLSIPADRDEYDDLVLLHEYGHFFQNEYSRSDSPGGPHSSRSRVDTRLAWGEGSATFLGNLAKGASLYLDTGAAGLLVRVDLEAPAASIPQGTSDGTQTGTISEARVSAVMWDLADTTNETKDTLKLENSVFSALKYLGSAKYSDRGNAGADLVDFLDGWFCRGRANRGTATTGVQGIVVGLHQFNYDFKVLPSCL
jgi:hypothetical protein